MFEQTFKNIDDILHKDAGCGSELDYEDQTSWVLFLKYLEEFVEQQKTFANSENSWTIDVQTLHATSLQYDLYAKNPNKKGRIRLASTIGNFATVRNCSKFILRQGFLPQ